MNLLKKIFKKTLICILIVLIICLTSTPKVTFGAEATTAESTSGMTEEELRDNFVNSIVNFYNIHGSQCSYDYTFGTPRATTYENGPDSGNYVFDCVGWVSCAFHWFMGLGNESFTFFVDPSSPLYIDDGTHFQRIDDISQAQKGDVLVAIDQHVAIYIGNGQVLDMYTNESGGLGIRNMNSTYNWNFVAHLYSFEGVTFNPIEGGAELPEEGEEGGEDGSGNWDTEEVDLDAIADVFTFDGMPPTIMYEEQRVDVFRWIFDGISGFMDFVAGLIISFIKAPILGFAGMLDDYIDSLLTSMN